MHVYLILLNSNVCVSYYCHYIYITLPIYTTWLYVVYVYISIMYVCVFLCASFTTPAALPRIVAASERSERTRRPQAE